MMGKGFSEKKIYKTTLNILKPRIKIENHIETQQVGVLNTK